MGRPPPKIGAVPFFYPTFFSEEDKVRIIIQKDFLTYLPAPFRIRVEN